ncbi:MAG: hypothetical protein ACO1OF_07470 [Adhaeribacter sp.]
MFIKRVISFILIFLVVFTLQVQDKEVKGIDSFAVVKIQNAIKVAEEETKLPNILY